jgi:Predicted 3'-5' exonuclease related to the exonuclease domain of PolB
VTLPSSSAGLLPAAFAPRVLVLDIETVPAQRADALPPRIAAALERHVARRQEETDKVMALSPLFGRILSLALGDGDDPDAPAQVLYALPPGDSLPDAPAWLHPTDEPALLRAFWPLAAGAETVVTFNGRNFDVPFLVLRSLVHSVPVGADLLRRGDRPHLDLWDVLGRDRGPSSLDVFCWALGIDSPKQGLHGSEVQAACERGEHLAIATYNAADVRATARLYQRARASLFQQRGEQH